MKIEKDEIDKKVDAIVHFVNYHARDLESDIVYEWVEEYYLDEEY